MKRTLFSLSIVIVMLLSACGFDIIPGSGKIIDEQRKVSGFDQVVFSAPGNMTLSQDGSEALEISADDNLLEYIDTYVENRTLYIEVKPEMVALQPTRPIRYTLNVKTLKAFTLNGSGDVSTGALENEKRFDLIIAGSGNFTADEFKTISLGYNLTGSGDLNAKTITADTVHVTMSGSGDTTIDKMICDDLVTVISGSGTYSASGKASTQTVQINGSGSYRAADLESATADVAISGSGDGQVKVTEKLNISITGSGSVNYSGGASVTQHVTGSGDVQSVD